MAVCLVFLLKMAVPLRAADPHYYVAHYENVLGTSMEIKVAVRSPQASALAKKAVLAEIARLSAILSGYDRNSEFSRWFRTSGVPVPVSPELFEVLSLFDLWRARTDGALDASAEAVTQVWKTAARENRLPDAVEIAAAVELVRQPHWRLDAVTRTAEHLDRVPLMLNSFAKSYIIERAAAAGRQADHIAVTDKAVPTSGNYRRGELIAGHWYSHIVDPRTGEPAEGILSATVISRSATDAGALATSFNVLSVPECIRLAAEYPGVDYLLITRDGQRVESPGWNKLRITGPKAAAARAGDFELLVNFEINLQKEGSVKRPYVAIWVEDKDHAIVKTVSVWHGSDRYLPELRSWWLKYRSNFFEDKNFGASVSSATRPAGKYSVKWDGTDDKGNPVKPGRYVLKIEISREHGTYQLMRQEFDWNDQPQTFTLPGNVEISSASLEYRKKNNGN